MALKSVGPYLPPLSLHGQIRSPLERLLCFRIEVDGPNSIVLTFYGCEEESSWRQPLSLRELRDSSSETAPQAKKTGGDATVASPTVPRSKPEKSEWVGVPPFLRILSPLRFLSCVRQPAVLCAKETTSRGRELVVAHAPGLGSAPTGDAARGGGGASHLPPHRIRR
jgi:hypothetical protein